MGKLIDKDTIGVRAPLLKVKPIAGWTWYCGYHDTYGLADDEEEALFMAGAHLHYFKVDEERCEIYTREWNVKEEGLGKAETDGD